MYAIYILESYQRKGLGRALIKPLLEQLIALKLNSLLVWVLEDNKSRYFYEALGGKMVERTVLQIAGEGYNELAYGWDDVKKLQKYLEEN
ncbi:GNAT family N-acetyltransferase [Alkalihalobacillus sp. AL-G]|uniref:GNAT family N-acetyltransferase n=1 Tax=Alkalihalobacillus sp. AL-G TaxID=2926399 RepID=UPI00272BD870|nr:GNAT family N-acetyltransferase [Alkalihalobacillus sp. AL-G]WLD94609.1 GNAT family N-acetyltransferase [Alkalihalobacillus sp. AL-G]